MKYKYFLLILTLFLLTSCFNTTLEFSIFSNYLDPIDTTYSFDTYSSLKLDYADPTTSSYQISDLTTLIASTNNGNTYKTISSKGDVNILVLPISFSDSDKTNQNEKIIYIKNAFFGQSDKNLNESLTSFYNKSSYGNLKIRGKVSDFYNFPMSGTNLKNKYNSALNSSRYVLDSALNWYKENNDDILDFDNDNDNYIDCIYLIYDYPFEYSSSSLFWSYTDRINANTKIIDYAINTTAPYASTYVWMSLNFIIGNNNLSDSHIVNHEFGHVLGLNDYYNETNYQPLGYSDIMDSNLGDHNAYSKMSLNWITPQVITKEGTYKLKTFFDTGHCLLIPAGDYNNTIFDEFLLIEFYAPSGVNYKDTLFDYIYHNGHNGDSAQISLFSQYGLKIYHVDSRLAYVKNKGLNNNIGYVDDPNIVEIMEKYKEQCQENEYTFTYCLDYATSNENINHPFISLLESSGLNSFKNGGIITNDTLFKKGHKFNSDLDFVFYNGSKLEYEINIENITSLEATISIIKN